MIISFIGYLNGYNFFPICTKRLNNRENEQLSNVFVLGIFLLIEGEEQLI